jgi:hypothetical protein
VEGKRPTGRVTKDTAFIEGRAKLRLILELLEAAYEKK